MGTGVGAGVGMVERLAAVSDGVRLRVLRLIEREELSVRELSAVLQLPQSTVSRHLKVLLDAGWIVKRAEGTSAFHRLVMDDLDEASRGVWSAIRARVDVAEVAEDDRRVLGVLAERRADSQAFFGRVAGQWDALRRELFGDRFTAQAALSLVPPDWVVADLGCGTGNAAELIGPWASRVIAVDRSEAMLEAARRRLSGMEHVEFAQGELEALPLADESVDATVCFLVLHYVDRPEAALAEMARVLRPDRGGGLAIVVDMGPHERAEYRHKMGHRHQGFSEERVTGMYEAAGFERPRFRWLTADPEARGPGLFAAVGRKKR